MARLVICHEGAHAGYWRSNPRVGRGAVTNQAIEDAMGEETVATAKKMYYAIELAVKGPAMTVVRSCPVYEGAEC